MNPIVYAFPVFLVTMGVEALVARRRGLKLYDIPDAITSLHTGILSQVAGVFVKLLTFTLYVLVYQKFAAISWPTDNILLWVIALLLYDFAYYWNHRLNHEVGVLWAAHIIHHSSEYFNLSTALRQSMTTGLVGWIFYLPLAVLGVPPVMLATVGLIDLLYQYWVHTQLIHRLGWLEKVMVTPANHRVHHGQNDYCIDRNYGGIFIVWDRMFGTWADERADERVVFGVRKPLESFNPLWANLHYYADLAQQSWRAKGWRNKLQAWIAPPGGWPTGPLEHFEAARFRLYDRHTPTAIRWYVLAHYGVINAMLAHFLIRLPGLDMPKTIGYAGVILGMTVVLGGLLQGTRWARPIEMLRLAALAAAALLPTWFGDAAPLLLRALIMLSSLASLAWLARATTMPAGAPAE
jgi:alkylglycerol monooxygenase